MRIFFEDYIYPADKVEPYIDKAYLSYLRNDRVSIPCVGYYYSSKADDTVFILPKVFINVVKEEDGDHELAFGRFNPIDIINASDKDNPLVKSEYFNQVFNLSTWIYRAIVRFKERNPESQIAKEEMRDVTDIKGNKSETWIDIILRLIRFNNEHRALFTYIAKINSQGYNKISWRKTMSAITPMLQDGSPVYLSFRNKTKVVNFDEELLVLFYSVLDYLHVQFNFKILRNVNYETDSKDVEKLIKSGKGTRLLKSIRKKYFKDELVELWNLLYVFFQKAQFVASKGTHREFLIARDFNIVFEDMIDSLISDETKERHPKFKDQPDGKIVDHIYDYDSLIQSQRKDQNGHIYYIGDSKYYKEGSDLGENSIFKQFTYVRNVIQMNMELWKPSEKEITRHNYYDEKTEGYNITPNFFIRGKINPDKIDYNDAQLVADTDEDGKPNIERKIHHHNRIFDRDTLFVQKYDINFLYVLTAYAQNHRDDSYKKRIREKFKENLLNWLSDNYRFLLLTPKKADDKEDALNKHFHELLGKVFSYGNNQYLMGLDLGKNESNTEEQLHRWEEDYNVWKSLEDDFRIEIFDIKQSLAKGIYQGEKLKAVVSDTKFASELNKYRIFNLEPTPLIEKYGKKYFGMEATDWKRIIEEYNIIRPSATVVSINDNQNKELPIAANPREGSFDPQQTKE